MTIPHIGRRLTTIATVLVLGSLSLGAQAPARQAAGEAKTIWYFYTVKWGAQDEFLDLFQRNHYPLLKAREKAGQYLSVKTFVPEFHGDGHPRDPGPLRLAEMQAMFD